MARKKITATTDNSEWKAPKKRKPRKPSGFAKPTYLSPELCTFLNVEKGTELARTEVTKRILQYVKDNNLQNQSNGRNWCVIRVDIGLDIACGIQMGIELLVYFSLVDIVVDIVREGGD